MNATWNFEGRVAIVTGATAGIGLAITRRMVEAGARVAAAARTASALEALEAEFGDRLVGVPTDVTQSGQVEALVKRAVERFGNVDIAVNNAGGSRIGPVSKLPDDSWDYTIDLSLRSVFNCVKHQSAQMIAQGSGGSIVNIGSLSGIVPQPFNAAYSAAKAGAAMLTRTAALELARHGIRVNAVLPGLVDTPATHRIATAPQVAPLFTNRIAMRRVGEPDEIAGPVMFLCSDAAAYVTGAALVVDGGWSLDGFPDLPSAGLGIGAVPAATTGPAGA